MAKKKSKNKQNKARIIETKLITVMPGMLMSAKTLIVKGDSEWKERDTEGLYPGTWVAAIIISAHCAELLLKYKIEQEGHIINRNTHDLYYLYNLLSTDSKTAIQKKFSEEVLTMTLPTGWTNAESVFEKARNACKDWRYTVEHKDISLTYLQPLYIAAVSVYKTLPISESRPTLTEVTDPTIIADILKGQI